MAERRPISRGFVLVPLAIVVASGPMFLASGELAHAARAPRLRNAGFEIGRLGEMPAGWHAYQAKTYRATVSKSPNRPRSGRACLEILHDPNERSGHAGAIYVQQMIDARPYRGRRVELSGWVRREAPAGVMWPVSIHLWLSSDGNPDGNADMENDAVRSPDWTFARTACEVPANADSLGVGAYLDAAGRAWIDDLSVRDCGPIGEADAGSRPLSEREATNLVAFGRLLGIVRHFHPSDEASMTHWDEFAIAGVEAAGRARSNEELVDILTRLFRPVAPTVRIATHALEPLIARERARSDSRATHIVGWIHRGWPSATPQPWYTKRRVVAPIDASGDSVLPFGSESRVELTDGVFASVPLTLTQGARGTLPRARGPAAARPARPRGWVATARDRSTRLAAILLFWNVVQHFYPNHDLLHEPWTDALVPALRRAATDQGESQFTITLRMLAARMEDGHAAVVEPHPGEAPVWPIAWRFVEEKLAVVQMDSTRAPGVRLGDEIVGLQGRPIEDWIALAREQWRASSAARTDVIVARNLGLLIEGDSLDLDLRSRGGATRRVTLHDEPHPRLAPAASAFVSEPRPGVLYVNMTRVSQQMLAEREKQMTEARGIVFDFRGYPMGSAWVAEHWVDSTLLGDQDRTPIIRRPDHTDSTYEVHQAEFRPRAPRLRSRAIFLIDARAQSMAETVLAAVESDRLGELVGEPTSGTSGNVTSVLLPGRYTISFSGARVVKRDGLRFVGVGILPTVPVSPTLAGIAEGRDEQLERAIELAAR
jgi:C-terminal processing protease CtpA/Prc